MDSLYPQRSSADLIRWLALSSIAGQAIWLVVTVAGGLLEPGYSMVRDAVSVLGARDAAHPWVFDVGVAIWGVALLFAALALLLDSPPGLRGPRRWLEPGLIAFTGIAQVLDGFPFPADCRWTIDERWGREGGLANAGERGSVSAAHPGSPGAGFQADD